MDKNEFLLIIDGSSLLSTQFYGNLPNEIMFAKTTEEKEKYFHKIMQTSTGVYTNAVYGFLRTLAHIMRDQKPTHLAIAWDLSRNTFRRRMYPEYKANRSETLIPLKSQFALCQEVLGRMGIRQFMSDEYEADDFCGTLSRRFEDAIPVRIMTKDNDYLQLVTGQTNLWMIHSTAKKTEELYKKYHITRTDDIPDRCFCFNPELVEREFGIEPSSVADLKGLQGDTSDNIKGVPGVGPATAVALIAKYKTVEALYEAMEGLDEKELKSLAASWKEIGVSRSPIGPLTKKGEELSGKEAAYLSKKLATIKCDIDLGDLSLEELSLNINRLETAKVLEELEFKSLFSDFEGTSSEEESSINYRIITDFDEVEAFIQKLLPSPEQVLSLKTSGSTATGQILGSVGIAILSEADEILGLAVSTKDENCFIFAEGFITTAYISDILARLDDSAVCISAFDIKSYMKQLTCSPFINSFDCMIAAYLLDPLSQQYSYTDICRSCFNRTVPSLESIVGKASIKELCEAKDERIIKAACTISNMAFISRPVLDERLKECGMRDIFYNIEMPLVFTLDAMEKEGILVKEDALKELAEQLNEGITELEKEIYDYVGEKFNINSPKQLGVILFEKLRLPYGKKTKSGYSTSADVLEKLKLEDPIVEKILDYRQLTKLKSTYADGLRAYIEDDGRIRTTFNQTVTATGRLSSTEPNLQNIPIRVEMGRMIRKVFVPKPGYVFVDADYSQIELRILAAMSGDEKLIAAYRNAQDIHTATASAVFHVPVDEVTPQLRSRAKAVNFGIVYGISSFGLGNGLNISKKEAEQYIADYFETYPQIKSFLDNLVASAREKGYAKTCFGRRRPIPELASSNFMQRSFGERIAMNSPIQGTAADIIKIAMLKVFARLHEECPQARLLLQVHDELLVEAPSAQAERVKCILKEEMQNAVDFAVKMEVGIEQGESWYEAH